MDASAFIALLDRSDSFHPLFYRLFGEVRSVLVTSGPVVAEGHGWFLRRYHQRRALQFVNFVRELAPLVIEPFRARQREQSVRLLTTFSDQPLIPRGR